MSAIQNRYEFVLLFDVKNGNPNGDPDAGNMPRMDDETRIGLVSDVCLKRKIRNYVELAKAGTEGNHIYVEEGSVLNEKNREAYKAVRGDNAPNDKKLNPQTDEEAYKLRQFMCDNFYDVRTFGAVMSTGINCGQVKGAVQIAFASSLEPISQSEITITRMAATNEGEKKKQEEGSDDQRTENRTMGRKYIIPYALYRAHGYISAKFAEKTGFGEADLELLWEALANMFEHDRSAARGEMSTRRLIIFKHESALGNAPAQTLFERVQISRNIDGEFKTIGKELDHQLPARNYSDYKVRINRDNLPQGVEIIERV
ncbi:type I-C CRISPR-associated protein Cas7/Csd2 [Candidatus Tokpelaia sp.]|uniref:type I-C CRISPR-associated protein Cas7/Csd2 n=1 Tax=Candidatus Tokpelaia sp. TaxID=2233777 RepID=UPI00123AC7DF|nr:type I-C CRISPR-associated protein Cas7/Csd2 [Candidatus Tokpelaia sp.]KAA6404667.1 type I-C CRISPR-associated protein Cas7/Csd2 [Candidatus Tokpelaia sp.]